MEVGIGQFSLPVILAVVLGVIYKAWPTISNRWKPLITIGVGLLLGIGAMFYTGEPVTPKLVVNYLLVGLMAGAAAIGLYESKRSIRNPRVPAIKAPITTKV